MAAIGPYGLPTHALCTHLTSHHWDRRLIVVLAPWHVPGKPMHIAASNLNHMPVPELAGKGVPTFSCCIHMQANALHCPGRMRICACLLIITMAHAGKMCTHTAMHARDNSCTQGTTCLQVGNGPLGKTQQNAPPALPSQPLLHTAQLPVEQSTAAPSRLHVRP